MLMLVVSLLVGCEPSDGLQPISPPTDSGSCAAAGTQLEKLQCMDRQGRPMWKNLDGEPFSKICETAEEQGNAFLQPGCVAVAKTCEEAIKCPVQ
jgi:hypothetical protein